jgi:hypothetical protein
MPSFRSRNNSAGQPLVLDVWANSISEVQSAIKIFLLLVVLAFLRLRISSFISQDPLFTLPLDINDGTNSSPEAQTAIKMLLLIAVMALLPVLVYLWFTDFFVPLWRSTLRAPTGRERRQQQKVQWKITRLRETLSRCLCKWFIIQLDNFQFSMVKGIQKYFENVVATCTTLTNHINYFQGNIRDMERIFNIVKTKSQHCLQTLTWNMQQSKASQAIDTWIRKICRYLHRMDQRWFKFQLHYHRQFTMEY